MPEVAKCQMFTYWTPFTIPTHHRMAYMTPTLELTNVSLITVLGCLSTVECHVGKDSTCEKTFNLTENNSTYMKKKFNLTSKPAFVNIIRPYIKECWFNYFCMCKLIRLGCSLMPHLKGEAIVKGKVRPYCHMEFLNAQPNSYLQDIANVSVISAAV